MNKSKWCSHGVWPLVVICEMGFHLQITVTIVIGSTGLLDVDLVDKDI